MKPQARYGVLAACLLLTVLLGGSTLAQEGSEVSLAVGEQKTIPAAGVKRVAVGNERIAEVKVVGKELLITGVGVGTTNLIIWDVSGKQATVPIHVTGRSPKTVYKELQDLLKGIEGISIRMMGERVVIDGQALTDADFERIKQVADLYQGQVANLVKMATGLKTLLSEQITQGLRQRGLNHATARSTGKAIILEGYVNSKEEMARAEQIAKTYTKDIVNALRVGSLDMILMDVFFVEVRNSAIKNFGINWQKTIDALGTLGIQAPLPGAKFSGSLGFSTSFTAGIRIMQQDGTGRVLANPQLVCESGGKADFLAGGEIPIPLITANTQTVVYKPYGIILKIEPKSDGQTIRSEINVEVSTLDPSVTVQGIPGFMTRKLNTSINIKPGETIVLGGLVSNDNSKDVDKVPGIGAIPIVGELFKSRNFQNRESELLLFATPSITSPDAQKGSIERIRQKYDQRGQDTKIKLLD